MKKGYARGSLLQGKHKNDNGFQYYTFDNAGTEDDELTADDVVEMSDVRQRGTGLQAERCVQKKTDEPPTFIDRRIKPGDTLQSLALQYGCPVAEIKRINNLVTDQQFFALVDVKIPLKRYGLLADIISTENIIASTSSETGRKARRRTVSCSDVPLSSDEETIFVRTISIRDQLNGSTSRDARTFLESMDKDLEKIRQSTSSYKGSLEEVKQTLTCKRFYPIEKMSIFNGTDCGIRWWNVVVVMILVAILVPLAYVVYMELNKRNITSSASISNTTEGS
ncbi:PREDICTED: lysM and putative peptidoglycan-binding domain-containing protein 3-like [Priapulus caudatus]|uniref:LysM and putative peptidoglycan-binding domain-containing protein 3-like n=1 Tax=Priapulus caudatus TaxID=37621 RepID=A0ABM1EGD1_PRICU|nr:PREDICTED: lysM and putative peptidoglycan-binding domain-containing protein 3-like [Priapulus caudatus]